MKSKRNKKILITGSNGYIGSNLESYLKKYWWVYSTDLTESKKEDFLSADISDFGAIENILKEVYPDVVIHTAGVSSLAKCESFPELAHKVNVVGTRNILKSIKAVNPSIKLVFLSSDYVFPGDTGNYSEKSTPNPSTVYGKTKLKSERDIQKQLKNYIILRSANVYGRGGNFFNFLVQNLRDSRPEKYFDDSFYTPTYIEYLLEAIKVLIEKDFSGLIHVAGREKVSRYSFALEVAKVLGEKSDLVMASKQLEGVLLSKDSSLNSNYSSKVLHIECPTISESLELLFNFNASSKING